MAFHEPSQPRQPYRSFVLLIPGVLDRYNIVSNEDKRRALLKTQAHLESLPKTQNVPAQSTQKGSKMTRSLAAKFELISLFGKSLKLVAGAGFEPATFGL